MRGRRKLVVGDLVELSPTGARALIARHQLPASNVWRIDHVLPMASYGRRTYLISSGETSLPAWSSHVRLVRHPRPKKLRTTI